MALVFAAGAAAAVASLASMPAMGEMPMPGGWAMSTLWTQMCGRTWAGAAVSFVGMWIAMMTAMMLPSVGPMLWRVARAAGWMREARAWPRAASVAAGYGFAWTAAGIVVYAIGAALAAVVMRAPALSRAVPVAAGAVVLSAGAFQFTAWKARHLACCRVAPGRCGALPERVGAAWRLGARFGFHCCCSSAGLTASLLVIGIMDWRAMAAVTAAIAIERLAPAGERAARAVGGVGVGAGAILIARAVGIG
ncbi:hypothetical protein WS62_04370 [Burkholderia sp. ABCPW 14]|uniref:DUF2182 domain-containing protein n=1 Tax=Burkholderia sp. ABCPW 14 TaxID=1637860 RepID=UPI000770D66A|nr:DUF2182 domain-containing protein [Burkholderia sp. ABCPW 14]KVD74673.1 hypothetical protein WS62_04370 [Burkholderia sp. ABCPW 14]